MTGPSDLQPTRREFLVAMSGAVVGTFVLPSLSQRSFPEMTATGEKKLLETRDVLIAPIKTEDGSLGFSLIWMERIEGRSVFSYWTPESDEEARQAQHFYDSVRKFDPRSKRRVVGKWFNRFADWLANENRSDEEDELLQAIYDDRTSDAPRLRYAEWLNEREDPLGEFIELQCRLEKTDRFDPLREPVSSRIQTLVDLYERDWLRPLRDLGLIFPVQRTGPSGCWRRGFVEYLWFEKPGILPERADRLFYLAPLLVHLSLRHDRIALDRIALLPQISRIRTIYAAEVVVEGTALDRFVSSPYLTGLRDLTLRKVDLQGPGADLFGRSELLARLERLSLFCCKWISVSGLEAVVSSPGVAGLRELDLSRCELDDEMLRIVSESAYLGGLTSLLLERNPITADGIDDLMKSSAADGLRSLNVGSCCIGDDGLETIAASPHLRKLEELRIGVTGITTLRPLLESGALSRLRLLECSFNKLSRDDIMLLANTEALANLEHLELSGLPVGPDGIRALVESPLLACLQHLNVSRAKLGIEGARILAGWKLRDQLRELVVDRDDVGDRGVTLLRGAFHPRVLRVFD